MQNLPIVILAHSVYFTVLDRAGYNRERPSCAVHSSAVLFVKNN